MTPVAPLSLLVRTLAVPARSCWRLARVPGAYRARIAWMLHLITYFAQVIAPGLLAFCDMMMTKQSKRLSLGKSQNTVYSSRLPEKSWCGVYCTCLHRDKLRLVKSDSGGVMVYMCDPVIVWRQGWTAPLTRSTAAPAYPQPLQG